MFGNIFISCENLLLEAFWNLFGSEWGCVLQKLKCVGSLLWSNCLCVCVCGM